MRHERTFSRLGIPTVPYLVYLPDGKIGLARSETAQNAWAVAMVSRHKSGWRVDAVHNTSCGRGTDDTVATAERITEEEATRFAIRVEVRE